MKHLSSLLSESASWAMTVKIMLVIKIVIYFFAMPISILLLPIIFIPYYFLHKYTNACEKDINSESKEDLSLVCEYQKKSLIALNFYGIILMIALGALLTLFVSSLFFL